MNDALRTNVFVRFSPETVAAACIYLAARVTKVPLPNRPHWFAVFGYAEADLREIAAAIMKLYRRAKPNAEALERAVEELRTKQQEQRLKNKLLSGTNTPQGAGTGGFSPAASHPGSPADGAAQSRPASASGGRAPPAAATATAAAAAAAAAPAAAAAAGRGDEKAPGSGGRHTPNGDVVTVKLHKENLQAVVEAIRRTDSSRSRSDHEEDDARKLKLKNYREERVARARSRSRTPTEKRRRHSSTPDRRRGGKTHKKDKERSRDKHRRRSAEREQAPPSHQQLSRQRSRSRSPVRSSKASKHDRLLQLTTSSSSSAGKRDRHGGARERSGRKEKKRNRERTAYETSHKRR